jgi:nucleoside-diphosphate-sugar epimerase
MGTREPGGIRAPTLPARDLDHVLRHTAHLWPRLQGARLFISGGTGFFGTWLLESMLWANDQLRLGLHATVLTRDPERFLQRAPHLATDPAIELLTGDMGSFAFPTQRLDAVIHAATEPVGAPGTFDPLWKLEADVSGTRRVLAMARQMGARRMLLTSSGAVYGRQPPEIERIPEDYAGAPDPTDPGSAYGEAKRVSELACAAAGEGGLETVIARCFAFVGPHLPLDANYAIGNFIRDALSGGPILVAGDGTAVRSYLYAADLAVWLWSLLLGGAPGRAYNVGSDAAVTIEQLAHVVARTVSPSAEVRVLGTVDGSPPQRYVPSVDRARTELGLVPLVALQDAIERTATWHRQAINFTPAERERTP